MHDLPRSVPAAMAPRQTLNARLLDWWIIFLLVVPVIGTFYPPETYFGTQIGTYEFEQIHAPITPVMLVMICLSIGWIYARLRRVRTVRHEILAYLFIAWTFASIGWSFDPMYSFQRALRILPMILLAVLFTQTHPINRMLRLMTIAFLISACASIIVGAAVPSLGLSRMIGSYESAWRGALLHKNSTGFTYALGLIVAAFAWRARAIGYRLALGTMVTCLLMVVMAQSATAMLSVAIAILPPVTLSLFDKSSNGVRMLVTSILMLLILLCACLAGFAADLFQAMGRDVTLTGRTEIWTATWNYIVDRPVMGYGYAFWGIDSAVRDSLWRDIKLPMPHAHNSWLDLMLQLGAIGMGIVALLMVLGLLRSLSALVIHRRPEAPLLLSIIIILLIRSMTEVQFSEPSTIGLFWLIWAGLRARRDLADPVHPAMTVRHAVA